MIGLLDMLIGNFTMEKSGCRHPNPLQVGRPHIRCLPTGGNEKYTMNEKDTMPTMRYCCLSVKLELKPINKFPENTGDTRTS